MTAPLVEVADLSRRFDVSPPWVTRVLQRRPRRILRALDGVNFTIAPQRTLGLVGESGCGKSTLARCLAGLMPPSSGEMRYEGRPIDLASRRDPRARRAIQMIFQDPYASLNPRWTVAQSVGDPLLAFGLAQSRAEMRAQVAELLVAAGLNPDDGAKYPHQFSGGQRQRIAVARALASRPAFLICDEPTSALDVSVQAAVLNLMRRLQRDHGLTYLFISHNLTVIEHMADEVGVMYLGHLVELQAKSALFVAPKHPYTRLLIETVPSLDTLGRASAPLKGEVPSPLDPPTGCAFHPRCPHANARCRRERPLPTPLPGGGSVACHAIAEGRL
ncbi:oligopeptide/dipeptide ABC transporter ATP-binding protein [Pararhodobacter sp. SW119]|uniref:ABC transporter ATP-binding protein n=1 Tax=Pararhodobacter sp. SW119 TaxID=2780075 RepID=UPI001ADF5BEF|nr:oligopeptide/dipeptide ABC transporter ATP-binding protein [Pararhodobacter sp. SW119]